jgi:drug/metabolite transporter (DMT)-like permease
VARVQLAAPTQMAEATAPAASADEKDDIKLLPPSTATPSNRSVVVGTVLAAASQLAWGYYPVLARALQTQKPGLTTLELLVALNTLAAAALSVISVVKRICHWQRPRVARQQSSGGRSGASLRLGLIVAFFGCVIATRAVTNLASAAFAPAHWCVMISLCTPICTAAIGRLVFRDQLPAGTGLALLGGLCGSALAIFGGGAGGGEGQPIGKQAALGVGLALLSTLALATYQHCVKRTKGLISETAILSLNYAVVLLPALLLLAIEDARGAAAPLASLRALGTLQWAYLLVFSLGIYVAGNLAQQLAIRALGPTLLSAVMPLRLLSSVSGSYLVLGEAVSSLAEAAGLLIVTATAVCYLGNQVLLSRRATRPAAPSARALEPCEPSGAASASDCETELTSTKS